MAYKKIIPFIDAENEASHSVLELAQSYSHNGADELYIFLFSKVEKEQIEFLTLLKQIAKRIDIPFMAGIHIERFEDAKKAFYTGASKIVIREESMPEESVLEEIVNRFGEDKVITEINEEFFIGTEPLPTKSVLLKHVNISERLTDWLKVMDVSVLIRDSLERNDLEELLNLPNTEGVSTNHFQGKDIRKAKRALKVKGIDINAFESSIRFDEFKKGPDGLVPVVVQDYKTAEVLMVAYMNKESYEKTLNTGRMTYYSRSRKELWCKGDTSGHYQYVMKLYIDCDSDTILAKVRQIGVACHTGNRTCFSNQLAAQEYDDTNPLTIFNDVYNVIMDRKKNPKEGSYTNYLLEKGMDKILKKCGEEATEIVIAAKNPDAEELKYEISDFLYHMMVLMVETGLEWDDIMKELSHRR